MVSLRVGDINLDQKTIHIKSTKGQKDRITILPDKILEPIMILMKSKNSLDFVFHSDQGGGLTKRTAQNVFQHAITTS